MKKILIVEDEPAISKMYQTAFQAEGFNVETALNGKEGLKIALENHPDLIILDIKLPDMDGLTVLNKLRDDSWGKNVSVFMLTNLDDSESISESMRKRVHQFIVKTDTDPNAVVDEARMVLKS